MINDVLHIAAHAAAQRKPTAAIPARNMADRHTARIGELSAHKYITARDSDAAAFGRSVAGESQSAAHGRPTPAIESRQTAGTNAARSRKYAAGINVRRAIAANGEDEL